MNANAEPVDRRSLLRSAGLALGAGGAAALAGPLMAGQRAEAANGSPLLLGQPNTASTFTQLTSSDATTSALWVVRGTRSTFSYSGAVVGDAATGFGLVGLSGTDHGILGISENASGLAATSLNWMGVQGQALGTGPNSIGVRGMGQATGVQGVATSNTGTGVQGSATSGVGVAGSAANAGGTGVAASAANGGTALRVTGVARFSRSGSATIPAGHASVLVPGVLLSPTSLALATLQQAAAGNVVSSVVPNRSASTLTINLLKAAAVDTKVAWFMVN